MGASRLGSNYDVLRNRGVPINPFIYIGFVKDNKDAQRMGRLSIWIPELGGDPRDESSWLVASYASPFAGATDYSTLSAGPDNGQQSYGLWMVPPDLNNEVAVFFANGDVTRAYWFACCFQQNMNHMVPGIAVDVTTEPSPPIHVSPVREYNKADPNINPDAPRRPPFHPLTDGLSSEGLNPDLERGPASTSARREAPSQVFGLLSPRGNTVHIDDNTENEFIRLRTRSGAQVLIHETTGYVYINSKSGNAWLEISDAGVDIYSMNSVSIRAEQDFNVRADRNIFLDAGSNISMRAGQKITMDAGNDINFATATNFNLNATSKLTVQAGSDGSIKVGGKLNLQSSSDTSLKAGGRQLRDGTTILDNCNQASDASDANAAVPQGKTALSTTKVQSPSSWNWKYGGGTVNTITSRMPTHEPWGGHPNSKVPPPPLDNVDINAGGSYGGGNASNVGPDGQLTDSGCSFGAANTKPISTTNYNAIKAASDKTGVPMATMLAFGDIESSFQAGVGASSSSAKGLYQFTSGTWNSMVTKYGNQYNVSSDPNTIYDPNANALMGGQFIKDNTTILQKQGISNPTPGQLYVMHFMGSGGGPKLISAAHDNPDADASAMFPQAAAANPSIFRGKTVGQVYNQLTTKADSKAQAYASQYGLDAPCDRGNGKDGVSGGTPNTPPDNAQAGDYQKYLGHYVGKNQECASLVKAVDNLPPTSQWRAGQGDLINNPPAVGTAIATFSPDGTYANSYQSSHAAIYLGQAPGGNGIQVLEQYNGQPARIKNYYNTGSGIANASNYRVVNVAGTKAI